MAMNDSGTCPDALNFNMMRLDGSTESLCDYRGKVILMINTASECGYTPQFEQLQTNTDPHPLPRFRLNGTLSNMPEFHKAFACKAGDPMVRAAQCVIW